MDSIDADRERERERENEAELGSGELLRIGEAKSHSVHREKNLRKQKLAHGSPRLLSTCCSKTI